MKCVLERLGIAGLLLAVVCVAGAPVQAQMPTDLTGIWTDQHHNRVVIAQSGRKLTLTAPDGHAFAGELDGDKVTLERDFTRVDVSAAPTRAQDAIVAQKLKVKLAGTVAREARVIDLSETRPSDIVWNSDFRITSVGSHTSQVTLNAEARYKLRWRDPPETMGNKLALTGPKGESYDRPVVGFKYADKSDDDYAARHLLVLAIATDCGAPCPAADAPFTVERVELRNLFGSPVAPVQYAGNQLAVARDQQMAETTISLDQAAVLRDQIAAVNLNVIEAKVTIRQGNGATGHSVQLTSTNLAHVLRQKLLIFLPGVLGSSLYVEPHLGSDDAIGACRKLPLGQGRDQCLKDALAACNKLPSGHHKDLCVHGEQLEAFPRFSTGRIPEGAGSAGIQYLKLLDCGRDGYPLPGAEAVKIDLFRSYGINEGSTIDTTPVSGVVRRLVSPESLVYGVEKLNALKAPPGHPVLTVNGQPAPYYIFQPWPYDWRGRLNGDVDLFMGPDDGRASVDAPYAVPPSIASIMRAKKAQYPFLAHKAALVGHSTGGLIMRGILIAPGIGDSVDKAAFIDVPFYGAPKAYYVYLTGDMGVPFLGQSQMTLLAPNMPILYYLAPNQYYPDPVAVINGNPRYRLHTDAGDIMRDLLAQAKKNGLYSDSGSPDGGWNGTLETDAALYAIKVNNGTPAIGYDNILVFTSDAKGAKATIGALKITPNAVTYDAANGDGTVPLVSQRGDFGNRVGVKFQAVASGALHTAAPNEEQVWEAIIKDQLVLVPR